MQRVSSIRAGCRYSDDSTLPRRAAPRRVLQGRGIRGVKLNRAYALVPRREGQVSADLRTFIIWGINEAYAFAGETREN